MGSNESGKESCSAQGHARFKLHDYLPSGRDLLFGPGKSFGQQGGIHPSGSPLTLFPCFGPQENATVASCSN